MVLSGTITLMILISRKSYLAYYSFAMDVYLEEIALLNEGIINRVTKAMGDIYGLKEIYLPVNNVNLNSI